MASATYSIDASRRRFLSTAPLAALAAGTVTTIVPDPVLALIAREKEIWAEFDRLSGIDGGYETDEWKLLDEEQGQAFDAVCRCEVETADGWRAAVALFEERSRDWLSEPIRSQLRSLLSSADRLLSQR